MISFKTLPLSLSRCYQHLNSTFFIDGLKRANILEVTSRVYIDFISLEVKTLLFTAVAKKRQYRIVMVVTHCTRLLCVLIPLSLRLD